MTGKLQQQEGFTLLELMVALTVLLIGVSGLLGMQISAMRATSYSRHATEATVLAEDRMEMLRTIPVSPTTPLPAGTYAPCPDPAMQCDRVDAQGLISATGLFIRSWGVVWNGAVGTLTVRVDWNERGSEPHTMLLRTQRQ